MAVFHKIKNVKTLENMNLLVEFENGELKKYDVQPLLEKWVVFQELQNEKLFELAKIDTGGYGVVWNKYIDLSCEELWENGVVVTDKNYFLIA